VWKPGIFTNFCQIEETGNYEGNLNGKHPIIQAIQAAFTIKAKIRICNLDDIFVTEQGAFLQFHSKYNLSNLHVPVFNFSDVPQSDLLNLKFQFLYDKIVQQEFTMFKTIWLELCRAAQRQLSIIWQLLRLDPTVGARSLLMRNDIILRLLPAKA